MEELNTHITKNVEHPPEREGKIRKSKEISREFLEEDNLNLEIPRRAVSVADLEKSNDKDIVGDYVIANDFLLAASGGSRVVLAYKTGGSQLLVVKEMEEIRMKEFAELNHWGVESPEEQLVKKGVDDAGILLPVETIKKDGKIFRFYESMDMNLEEYLEKHKKLSLKTAVTLCLIIGRSIENLHSSHIIHGDILPTNILLRDNNIKLIDLDNSTNIDPNGEKSKRNYIGGNRFSMAPELLEANPTFDKTVDIYALAALLYKLITGSWPYNIERETEGLDFEKKISEYRKVHQTEKINFPSSVPLEIQNVVWKAMRTNPQNRYQSMEEFLAELESTTEEPIEIKNSSREEE